ncbi:hypothetical protein G8S55_13135 [Clostridium botulinum C]|uniref:hypothetical protein n=1 Tax=Clostridium botulinum TaxID=1491 RepID=UPI001E55867C|nr:hypothetical protein [Clostridium botulinum]MCD3218138.1 hypothetical protein [Clostridium botulinum C]
MSREYTTEETFNLSQLISINAGMSRIVFLNDKKSIVQYIMNGGAVVSTLFSLWFSAPLTVTVANTIGGLFCNSYTSTSKLAKDFAKNSLRDLPIIIDQMNKGKWPLVKIRMNVLEYNNVRIIGACKVTAIKGNGGWFTTA